MEFEVSIMEYAQDPGRRMLNDALGYLYYLADYGYMMNDHSMGQAFTAPLEEVATWLTAVQADPVASTIEDEIGVIEAAFLLLVVSGITAHVEGPDASIEPHLPMLRTKLADYRVFRKDNRRLPLSRQATQGARCPSPLIKLSRSSSRGKSTKPTNARAPSCETPFA